MRALAGAATLRAMARARRRPAPRLAVLAGGSGTRFWPLGRAGRPKQVLALDGDDARPLLALTLDRVAPLGDRAPLVVAPAPLAGVLARAAGGRAHRLLREPLPRNTAPAVVLAALVAAREDARRPLLVVPSDHHVAPLGRYRQALRAMAARAQAADVLVTLGLVPSWPATGYGWLELGPRVAGSTGLPVHRVLRYVEKPPLARARRMLAGGRHRWNGGTFAFRPEVLLEEARRLVPGMVTALAAALARRGGAAQQRALARAYRALAPASVDTALMERARHVETVAAALAWDDLGSFDAMARQRRPDARGNRVRGAVTLVDAEGCVVEAEAGHVALLGVKDLVVVRTADTVLVLPRGAGERVREIVARLSAEGRGELLS